MQVSQFEIHRLVQRTLEALGAGYGADRDGARAVAWLEAHGLPGLAALAANLPELERGIKPPKLESAAAGNAAIDAAGLSAIAFGGAAFDLLLTRAPASGKGQANLHLRRCRSPLFLIPAALEAGPGSAFGLAWRTHLGEVMALVEADAVVRLFIRPGGDLPTLLLQPAAVDVDIQLAPTARGLSPVPEGMIAVVDRESLARQFARALDHGIAVDPALWRRIDAVAARVQVPASEESRRKGAGGGDANA